MATLIPKLGSMFLVPITCTPGVDVVVQGAGIALIQPKSNHGLVEKSSPIHRKTTHLNNLQVESHTLQKITLNMERTHG